MSPVRNIDEDRRRMQELSDLVRDGKPITRLALWLDQHGYPSCAWWHRTYGPNPLVAA